LGFYHGSDAGVGLPKVGLKGGLLANWFGKWKPFFPIKSQNQNQIKNHNIIIFSKDASFW
jgi:hypothetical protein